jgi:hypothetical protein
MLKPSFEEQVDIYEGLHCDTCDALIRIALVPDVPFTHGDEHPPLARHTVFDVVHAAT